MTTAAQPPRVRWTPLQLGLVLLFTFVVLVGGTDAGRYHTIVRAAMAVLGTGVIAFWLRRAPREADVVDQSRAGRASCSSC